MGLKKGVWRFWAINVVVVVLLFVLLDRRDVYVSSLVRRDRVLIGDDAGFCPSPSDAS